jgi:NACalpha-BTF3-like transcription factor
MDCSICFESLKIQEIIQLSCGHSFHASCVTPWLETKGSCPNCRHTEREVEESDSDSEVWSHEILERMQAYMQSLHAFESRMAERDMREYANNSVANFVHTMFGPPRVAPAVQPLSLQIPQPQQPTLPIISDIHETETQYECTINGICVRITNKTDIRLIQEQTEASLANCLSAYHYFEGDIVNAIMHLSGM